MPRILALLGHFDAKNDKKAAKKVEYGPLTSS